MKKAIITGITGQDGYYLTKLLLKKGYQVHGLKRRSSLINTQRINEFFDNKKIKDKKFFLHHGDMTDSSSLISLINKVKPEEIYNLAAQSHVKVSFEIPEYTWEKLMNLKLWVVDALRYEPHPSHSHLERTLKWIERAKPERSIITNMHVDLDFETLYHELPINVEPAFDMLSITL